MLCTEVTAAEVAAEVHVAGGEALPPIVPYCFPVHDVALAPALPHGVPLVSGGEPDFGELTVLSVLRRYLPLFLAKHPQGLSADQQSVLERILECRTWALGAFVWKCRWCGHRHVGCNACMCRSLCLSFYQY